MESSYTHIPSHSAAEPGKIFVGGLSWETTKEGLQDYFKNFGEVADAVIMVDPATKKPRGFGFVTYKNPAAVAAVLSHKTPHIIDGKTVDPKPAQQRESSLTTTGGGGGGGGGGGAGGGGGGGGAGGVKKIFVGGLSNETEEDDVRVYFSQYGNVMDVDLKFDKATQRMRGFGFVGFETEEIVDKVVQIHFHQIKGKTVEAKKAQPRNSTVPQPRQTGYTDYQQQQQQQQQYPSSSYAYQQAMQYYSNNYSQYNAAAMYGGGAGRYPTPQVQTAAYSQDTSAYDSPGYNAEASATAYGGQNSYSYSNHAGYGAEVQSQQPNAMASYSLGQQRQQQSQHQQRGGLY